MSQPFSNINNSFNIINCTSPDDESKILAWLSPLEPWVRHRDIGAQRIDSVGDWLLEAEEFRLWHNGSREGELNHATLFCDGNPGVGKSYMISLVIDKLCDEAVRDDTAVTCFYFDFASRNEQSPINMLGSLLRQLVNGLGGIPEEVVRGFRDQQKVIGGRRLQVSGILGMFQTIAVRKRTFICVDALDECVPEHRMVILEALGQILRGSPRTRIFMTGRSHVRSEVERKLDGAANFLLIQPSEDGFVRFLREKLRNDTSPDTMSAGLEAAIMKSIPEMSSETFLLASLHVDAILQETTIARRRNRLKSLKNGAGLEDAYGVTLERIKAQDRGKVELAMAALAWICHAERPLLVDELCNALAVEIGATDFDPENVPPIGTLLGCCQGFIAVDKEASTVRLIHFTVQEYLCARPDLFIRPHSTIAETCLTYLNSHQVKDLSFEPLLDYENVPFLKYSSRYWGTHANKELSEHARTLAIELLSQYSKHISAVSLFKQALRPRYIELTSTSPLFSGLHCASFFGIIELFTALINDKSCDINQRDSIGRTPLSWAAGMGHEEMVKILLGREYIDPSLPDKHNRTPLGWAALYGHEGVLKLLLGRGDFDPNHADNGGRTPLGLAAFEGHEGVLKLLLRGADVNPNRPDDQDSTPLLLASYNGHERAVNLLLDQKDVDPNRPDAFDQTPLWCAAWRGHEGVVGLLLAREDVDPNRPDEYYRTPLGIASSEGHEGVVKLLLGRQDINPDWPDIHDATPLLLAVYNGRGGVAELLLGRKDVDPNRPNEKGQTPLAVAACSGHEGVVRLLLAQEDIHPDKPDSRDATPLLLAAYHGHEGVAKLLLNRKDVDPNHADVYGRTPLGWTAIYGQEGVVKLLLEREDVDSNQVDHNGRTPLANAAFCGHEEVVKLLLGRQDVNPDRPDVDDRTPLANAALYGHEEVVFLLLGRQDVNPDRPDNLDATPLSLAAYNGHEGVTKLLLDRKDVDPNRPNEKGQTPLAVAAFSGHEGVARLLLAREDIHPDRPDSRDATPLLLATYNGHEGVAKLLLARKDVDPNHPDVYDRTPLRWAALGGHGGVVQLLLEREGSNLMR